jgi:hypothetical protein
MEIPPSRIETNPLGHSPIIIEDSEQGNRHWYRPVEIRKAGNESRPDQLKRYIEKPAGEGKILLYEEVVPDVNIGPKKWHEDLFIEYELTFGRGMAYDVTHGFATPSTTPLEIKKRSEIEDDYTRIKDSFAYPSTVSSGSEEDANRIIKELQDFRRKYPELYTDIELKDSSNEEFRILS